MKKILVSGGWGYGNLGDDALLIATIELLKEKYPISELVIMSYDFNDTKKVLEKYDVKVVPSIHRVISKKLAFKKLGTWNKSFNLFKLPKLLQRIISRVRYPQLVSKEKKIYNRQERFLNEIIKSTLFEEFESSNLFIMSGGGYFNSWSDNLSSRVLELLLAKKANLKSLVIGQSIGPFLTKDLANRAYSGLKHADVICVRDKHSLNELNDLGLDCDIAPDLALANIDFNVEKNNQVSIILGEFPEAKMQELIDGLLNVSKKIGCSYKLLITRLYNADVTVIKKVHKALVEGKVNVELIIPMSYEELQTELANSRVVVSRNLHGLILGWRAGVPSVCLNHERKFITFMNQSSQSERLLNVDDISENKLTELILQAYNNTSNITAIRAEISKSVKDNFFQKLEALEID